MFKTTYYEPSTLWINLTCSDGSNLAIDYKKVYALKTNEREGATEVWAINDSLPFLVKETIDEIEEKVREAMKELYERKHQV